MKESYTQAIDTKIAQMKQLQESLFDLLKTAKLLGRESVSQDFVLLKFELPMVPFEGKQFRIDTGEAMKIIETQVQELTKKLEKANNEFTKL